VVHLYSRMLVSHFTSSLGSQFLMDSVGCLIVTVGVIAFSACMVYIIWEFNVFCFLLILSEAFSNISVPQNVPFVIIATNNLLVDGCHKSSTSGRSLPKFNYTMLLFYWHQTLQGLRHVFHVEFCSSMLLFFLVIFWCFYCVLGEYHVRYEVCNWCLSHIIGCRWELFVLLWK